MQYWKTHKQLRIALIALFFVVGFALLIYGWMLKGSLAGLGIMVIGLALLLAALTIYNKPFQDPKNKAKKK